MLAASAMSISIEEEEAACTGAATANTCAWAASIRSAYILLGGGAATGATAAAGRRADVVGELPLRSSIGVDVDGLAFDIGGSAGGIGVREVCLTRNGRPSAIAPLWRSNQSQVIYDTSTSS